MNEARSVFARAARLWWNDLWRYTVCGTGAVAADYAVWWMLTARAHWSGTLALLVSRPAGGLVSFLGNREWTWRRRRTFSLSRQFCRFWIVWAAGYLVAAGSSFAYARAWPHDRLLAKIAADLTAAVFGFLLQRTFTFR
jgi:putative flippase GtrA